MLTPDDRREIDEQIANRLEADGIVKIFTSLDEKAKEQIAQHISRFMSDRAQMLRKPENFYTPQWRKQGQDINYTSPTEFYKENVAGHVGPTLPRVVDLQGANWEAWLTATDPQILNLRVRAAGGADCMFDHLVSVEWATEVANSRGVEGQTFTSITGHTFQVWSTWQGAIDACEVSSLGSGGNDDKKTIFVCSGNYTEDVTMSMDASADPQPDIWGAGIDRVFVRSIDIQRGQNSGTGADIWRDFSIKGNGTLTIQTDNTDTGTSLMFINVCFNSTGGSGGTVLFDNPDHVKFFNCQFSGGTIEMKNADRVTIQNCTFSATATLYLTVVCENMVITGNVFFQSSRIVTEGTFGRGLTESVIANNYFHVNTAIESSIEFGDSSGSSDLANVSIQGNIFEAVSGGSISQSWILFSNAKSSTPENQSCTITGNTFMGATACVKNNDSADHMYNVVFMGNTIQPNASQQWTEDSGGATVSGRFQRSTFGPNAPAQKLYYNITTLSSNEINGIDYTAGTPTHSAQRGKLAFDYTNAIYYMNTHASYGATWTAVTITGGGTPAPVDAQYLTLATNATLTNERVWTPGSGLQGADAGAGSTYTVKLGPLTETWDQSGAFTIVQRGAALRIANGQDLELFSDNSATPTSQTAEWDAATGHIAIGPSLAIDTAKIIVINKALSAGTSIGVHLTMEQDTAGTTATAWQSSLLGPSSGVQTTLRGILSNVTHQSSGALTTMQGIVTQLLSSGAGAITTGIGLDVLASAWASNVPATTYVLRAGNVGGAGATAYGIYVPAQTGSVVRSFIADALVLGGSDRASAAQLDLAGAIRFDGIAAPATPASDDITVYDETGTDLLKAIDDNAAVYALMHQHVVNCLVDGTVTTQKTVAVRFPHAGTITNVTSKTCDGITIGATAWVGTIYLVPSANINTDGGTTEIFTVRPTITNGNMRQDYGAPDLTTAFAAGDVLVFATTQVGTSATFVAMTARVRYT